MQCSIVIFLINKNYNIEFRETYSTFEQFPRIFNEMRWQGQNYRSLIQKATCKKKRRDASSRTKRSVEVDRRRGESLSIMYRTRANIKFSNCKIDAAYVTSSVSFSLSFLGVAVSSSSVVTSTRPRDSIASTTMPRVSRVPSSFYCKATPHIVQGHVIHFLPDSAQLFINCCSLGGEDLSSPSDAARRGAALLSRIATTLLRRAIKKGKSKRFGSPVYNRPVATRHLERSRERCNL